MSLLHQHYSLSVIWSDNNNTQPFYGPFSRWAGTRNRVAISGILMAPDWLLELSRCHLLLYDR